MATGRIGTTPVLTTRWSKAPAAGTTSLSGLDDNSVSLVYSVGYEQVYLNGALLSRTNDYTATNGTTITLTNATVAGDIVEVFANAVVPLTDTYTQTVANGKFINNTLTTTTGDIIYASAANTPARLGIGSSGQVLTVSGGVPSWAAAAGGGKVLQVVQGTRTTVTTITSTTYVTTNISASITPSLATSKVLILFSCPINTYRATNETPSTRLAIYDGSTQIYEAWGPYWKIEGPSVSTARSQGEVTGVYLDSPATTSAKTYTIQGKLDTTSNSAEFNAPTGSFAGGGTIVLMEIGA